MEEFESCLTAMFITPGLAPVVMSIVADSYSCLIDVIAERELQDLVRSSLSDRLLTLENRLSRVAGSLQRLRVEFTA